MKRALSSLNDFKFIYLDNHETFFEDLKKNKNHIDYAFNICDEGFFNQAKKELHIPYTGSNPQSLAFCYDKSLVRGIAREMKISVPEAFYLKPEDNIYEMNFSFPVIIKPNLGDSSYAITQHSVAHNLEEVINAVDQVRNVIDSRSSIIIEEFLPGKDLSLGMIGNLPNAIQLLPIIEEDYSKLPEGLPQICGYEAKWDPKSPYWSITSKPTEISEDIKKYIEESSLKLFERLECNDYCRFDWRLDKDNQPHLLEVNPNPGWCWDGHLARMCKIDSISYSEMIQKILTAAEERLDLATPNGTVKKEECLLEQS